MTTENARTSLSLALARRLAAVGLLAGVLTLLATPPGASAGITERVSVDSGGTQGNGYSASAAISADGRFVAFWSFATNLVPGDINESADVFVHDRETGTTERVSVGVAGTQGNGDSFDPSISADGRFVAFWSHATNLVLLDANRFFKGDVFVHDRLTRITELVSMNSAGDQANAESTQPSISADGRFVAFVSYASNLVPGDTEGWRDVYVRDRQSRTTERVSVSSAGVQGNRDSSEPAISATGRFVTFGSDATNLVAGDTNGYYDVFVHDRQTGITERVSVDSTGTEGDLPSNPGALSADGRLVVFWSLATNLVAGDTNGATDVFVHDRLTGTTERVSVDSAGNQAAGWSSGTPSMSTDGRFVAFLSAATNLVPGDTNGVFDVFVHDRQTGTTERVSVSNAGNEGDDGSFSVVAALSADGRFVAFQSYATNLVPGDTNGVEDVFVHDRRSPDAP
jgi:Tol biopolymer transport system component